MVSTHFIHSFIHSSIPPSTNQALEKHLQRLGTGKSNTQSYLSRSTNGNYCDFWLEIWIFMRPYAHQTETENQSIWEQISIIVTLRHTVGVAPSPSTPAPLPSPVLPGLAGSGVLRGLRGMMISSTLTPSSVCFSETWERSSDWLGEKRLQHLHMKMAGFSVRKKKAKYVISSSPKQWLHPNAKEKYWRLLFWAITRRQQVCPSGGRCTAKQLTSNCRWPRLPENSFFNIPKPQSFWTVSNMDLPVTLIYLRV